MPDPDLSVRNRSEAENDRPAGPAPTRPLDGTTPGPTNKPRRTFPWKAFKSTAIFIVAFPILCDVFVTVFAMGKVYDSIDQLPPTPVALVLGTSKHQKKGPNLFYTPRMEAATALFASGRIQGILVSGDNGSIYYNEPETMRRDLVALGVPTAFITLDYAGFRTLDSMVRAKKVFGLSEVVVVSQRFHAQRAVFLGAVNGLQVTALAAADPKLDWFLKVRAREILARTVAVLDVIIGREPRFLGDPEKVNLRPPADDGSTSSEH